MKRLKLHPRKGQKDNKTIEEYVKVDDEDYEELSKYSWYFKFDNANDDRVHNSIGRTSKKGDKNHLRSSLVLMNRQILKLDDPSIHVHFKDGNILNMQKKNLYVKLNGHQFLRLLKHWQELTRITIQTEIDR